MFDYSKTKLTKTERNTNIEDGGINKILLIPRKWER